MAKDGEATFRINIDGNAAAVSKDVASSARLAAKSIETYETEVKALSADLRRLKGNSDDVVAAKTAIKKRIDEVKASASALTATLIKQGTTYTAAAAAAKKYGDGVGRLPNLSRTIGKALDPAKKKIGQFRESAGTLAKSIGEKIAPAGGRLARFGSAAAKMGKAVKEDVGSVLPSVGTIISGLEGGAVAGAAAIAALGAAFVAGGLAIAAFGAAAADAHAKMGRQREALLGNAKDAKTLGDQIASLSGKVPQGVEELNALSVELSKTRLSGKAIVDTLGAVAQATGAVDASAGDKIKELVTRSQLSGRFFLNQLELQGTGIDFDDVAKQYAAGTKKSIEAARSELMRGQVPLEQGAEALKKATEAKFGDINLRNAFSLENGPKKLKEQLGQLSKGVDLGPISKALQDAFGQLDENAPLGAAVKQFMETFGTGLVDIAAKSIPVLIEGVKWLLVWALKLGTTYYETKEKIREAFAAGDWVGVGREVIKGLAKGLTFFDPIQGAVRSLTDGVKKAFTNDLEIHSPSKVFEGYGRNTTEGYAIGVERGSSRASEAVRGMGAGLPAPAGASSTSSSESIVVNIHGAPTGNADAMRSPAFLAELTRAIRDARVSRGLVPAGGLT